jgi:hypothetical protein
MHYTRADTCRCNGIDATEREIAVDGNANVGWYDWFNAQ